MDTHENMPQDQPSDAATSGVRISATGESSRGRRRPRSSDGAAEHENGNESDMDLELLAESESDSDEDGLTPGEGRNRRVTTGGYDPVNNTRTVPRHVCYSEEDSSSGDEDVVENEIDQMEDEEEMDDEEGGRDENDNSGGRLLNVQRVGKLIDLSLFSSINIT